MNIPEWFKLGLYGAAAGAVALAIVDFSWGGRVTGSAAHNPSPDAFKELFDLKPDYPLVAPSYAETRSRIVKRLV